MPVEHPELFRESIVRELDIARQALADAEGGNATVELDQARVGRLSRMDALQQQAMSAGLRERLLVRIRRLQAAEARIEAGEFGDCCECGDPIPVERLTIDVAAPFCAACQQAIGKGRRGR